MSLTKYRIVGVVRRSDWSTVCMRRSRASANSGRGSTGTIGSRSASSGSAGMVVSLLVLAAQRGARARQERLGAMDGPPKMLGHSGDGESVEIAQRERRPLRNGQMRQGGIRRLGVQPFVPWVVDVRGRSFGRGEAALLALETAPVVDQFVARHAHEPGGTHLGQTALTARVDGCQERLAGQVLSQRRVAAAGEQIAVHLRQGHAIDGQHRVARRGPRLIASHTNTIARRPLLPNMPLSREATREHSGLRPSGAARIPHNGHRSLGRPPGDENGVVRGYPREVAELVKVGLCLVLPAPDGLPTISTATILATLRETGYTRRRVGTRRRGDGAVRRPVSTPGRAARRRVDRFASSLPGSRWAACWSALAVEPPARRAVRLLAGDPEGGVEREAVEVPGRWAGARCAVGGRERVALDLRRPPLLAVEPGQSLQRRS